MPRTIHRYQSIGARTLVVTIVPAMINMLRISSNKTNKKLLRWKFHKKNVKIYIEKDETIEEEDKGIVSNRKRLDMV